MTRKTGTPSNHYCNTSTGGRIKVHDEDSTKENPRRSYVVRDGVLVKGASERDAKYAFVLHNSSFASATYCAFFVNAEVTFHFPYSGRVVSNWGMGNPDPAAVRKHWQLFRKQVKLGL
jgi:hypothetical protein